MTKAGTGSFDADDPCVQINPVPRRRGGIVLVAQHQLDAALLELRALAAAEQRVQFFYADRADPPLATRLSRLPGPVAQ